MVANPPLGSQTPRRTGTQPLSNPFTPPIPVPTAEVNNLRACVEALKSSVESLAGQRGDAANRAVTFRDLVSFGVISPAALQSSSGAGNAVGGIIGNYLPLTGGTLTGLLTLSGPPTAALHAATKAYVDGQAPLGGPYLPLTGGTLSGALAITDLTTSSLSSLSLSAVNDGNGVNFKMTGNGATTPSKTIRVINGTFQIVNDAYTAVPFQLTDAGNLTVGGTVTAPTFVGALTGHASLDLALTGGTVTGALTVTQAINTFGVNANLRFEDRHAPGTQWSWYADGGSARLWLGTDRLSIDSNGNMNVVGNLQANGWFSTGLNTAAYPSGTGAFAISWNHTQGSGETDFWNTYQSVSGFNSFHFWQMTGASTAIDIMQVGPSGLQLSGSLVTTGAQSGWNMNDRLAGQTPSGWVIYPSGGKLIIYNNFNSDAYYFYYSAFVPAHDNANWCGQAGTAWYACQSYAYNTSSDMRHKTDIEDLPGCLDFVRRLAPKRFKFNNAPPEDRQRSHWGFIAQEVGAAFRETDFGGHRADPAGESISYNELTAVLWKVCQELLARVEQLEAA